MLNYFSTCFQLTDTYNDVFLKLILILALITYIIHVILLSKTYHNKKIIIIKKKIKEACFDNYINEKIETKAKILHVYINEKLEIKAKILHEILNEMLQNKANELIKAINNQVENKILDIVKNQKTIETSKAVERTSLEKIKKQAHISAFLKLN